MKLVENVIDKIGHRPSQRRAVSDLRYIVLHRFGSHDLYWYSQHGIPPNALGVAEYYRSFPEAAAATGGRMPYAFVIGIGGRIWQASEVFDVTPHAKRFNREGIGMAFLGDHRFILPTKEQWRAGVDLCSALTRLWGHLQIVGHTDLGGSATSDQEKRCPGACFDVTLFAAEVQSVNLTQAGNALLDMGVEF